MVGESVKKLTSELETLKTVLGQPRIWLSNYFSELKNNIDIEFTKFLAEERSEDETKQATSHYEEIIDKVVKIEKNCFNNLKTDRINDEEVQMQAEASINKIEQMISSLDSKISSETDLDLIDTLIYETLLKIQLSLVLNTGLIFLNVTGLFGTLFIVDGQFFGDRSSDKIE